MNKKYILNDMRCLFIIACFVLFVFNSSGQPPSLGLQLWIVADSLEMPEGNEIGSLINRVNSDVSTISQSKAVKRQVEELIDHFVIDFSDVNAKYDFDLSVDLPLTTFILYYTENSAQQFFYDTDNRMVGYLTSSSTGQYGSGLSYSFDSSSFFKISSFTTSLSSSKVYVNGILKNEGVNDRPISNKFCLGGAWNNTRYFDGYIAEVLIYDYELNNEERSTVEQYLMDRYSPPVSVHEGDTIVPNCSTELFVKSRFKQYSWNRLLPDGSYHILGDQSSQIVSEPGKYIIEVVDIFDRISSDTITVKGINENDLINSTICQEHGVQIDLAMNENSFVISWSDPSLSGSQVAITAPGEYSVEITQADGCTYQSPAFIVSDIEEITEIEMPELFCAGNFMEATVGKIAGVDLLWSTGEISNSITPQGSGIYWVEATNANGCIGRDTVEVDIVGAAPEVAFTSGVACKGNEVVFTDETDPTGSTISDQSWVFGSAPFDSAQGPMAGHTFPETGSYPIELTVTLANGCMGTGRDTVEVHPLPLVGFNYDAVIPCAGNEVAFESQSGVPGNGSIAGYAWSFGNGTTDTGIVGTTSFENQGVNTVQLSVTTTQGCVDSLMAQVVVLGSPVVDFTFDTVCVGTATVFNEMVDTSESGSVFYTWKFGDGFFSNFPNTSHTYSAPGVYMVQLTATGNDFGSAGCMDTMTKEVRVYAAPVGQITTTPGCMGEEVVFTDHTAASVQGGVGDYISSRQWVLPFGSAQGPVIVGGDSVQVWNPVGEGVYLVELGFETAAGCVGTASANVEVLAVPEAGFVLELPEVSLPFTVSPQNTSVDAQSYAWFVNGVGVSTVAEPELTFADTGAYEVSLVAANAAGCNDTVVQGFYIVDPYYDLAILDIRYSLVGDKLGLRALLANNGNTTLAGFDMEVRLGLSLGMDEFVDFVLLPGDVVEFTLPQMFEYLAARDLPYVCISVGLGSLGIVEGDVENNSFCVGLKKDGAVFIDPYPNPTGGVVKLGFVLPTAGDVEVEVSEVSGKVVDGFTLSLAEGYSLFDYDMGDFSKGVYFVRYRFGGVSETRRVVVGF